jgi:hypothetical protein
MTYLHCPRCRLAIRCRAHYLMLTNCPRCLARARIVSPLFASPLDAHELHAGDGLPAIRAADPSPLPRSGGELPAIRAADPSPLPRSGGELPAIRAADPSRSPRAAAEPRRSRS